MMAAKRRNRRNDLEPLHRAALFVRAPFSADVVEWVRSEASKLEASPELVDKSFGGYYTGRLE